MAARPARPGSGRVLAICTRFPRLRPGMGDLRPFAPALVPVWSIRPARCTASASGFAPFFGFSPFRGFLPVPGGGWQQHCLGVKSLQFFHSLRRRAGERRRGALKVVAYTLYAMPNSPPCIMPSGMVLFLCPARCARSH